MVPYLHIVGSDKYILYLDNIMHDHNMKYKNIYLLNRHYYFIKLRINGFEDFTECP